MYWKKMVYLKAVMIAQWLDIISQCLEGVRQLCNIYNAGTYLEATHF